MENRQALIRFRLMTPDDIKGVIDLQRMSFPRMASRGEIWEEPELKRYMRLFPEGQFCAQINDKIVGSASSLVITMNPEYKTHTWYDICYDSIEKTHDIHGDTLYDVDISVLPEYRHIGIASRLYSLRKELAIKIGLRRMIGGGRLSNFYKYCSHMNAQQYLKMVTNIEIEEPALNCQIKNGFQIVKLLPNYLPDEDSLNYAAFIEWKSKDAYSLSKI
jgi:ribosomal protein S18 acetylase RimI-like enzyme